MMNRVTFVITHKQAAYIAHDLEAAGIKVLFVLNMIYSSILSTQSKSGWNQSSIALEHDIYMLFLYLAKSLPK